MGKKLIFDYTFTPSAKTVKLNDVFAQKRLLLITNVSTGTIIYQFNDAALGLSDIDFDYANFETTLTLSYDTTSMSSTDQLQILIEEESTDITVNERFVDPVSKIRVSNPENLIDTDFEYGLQSTKWETLELTNNIPTFFARNGDFDIDVTDMTVVEGSDIVTVTCPDAHNLQRGAPIIVQSSGSASADGGFVVSSILSPTSFNYIAKSTFLQTRSIKETFTQLFPGSVYSGTEFKLTNVGGITTDAANPSTLTVSTQFPTDFNNGTSMALSNTFAKATLSFDTSNVDIDNTSALSVSYTNSTTTGENDGFLLGGASSISWQPDFNKTFGIYFAEDEITVDASTDRITFSGGHPFSGGELVAYLGDTSNTPIGGMSYMNAYFVNVIDSNTIQFHTFRTTSLTSGRVNLTGAGVSGGVVKSAFINAYWQTYYYGYSYFSSVYRGTAFLYLNSSFTGANTNTYAQFQYDYPNNPVFAVEINGLGHPYFAESTDITDPASNSAYDYYMRARTSSTFYNGLTYIYAANNGSLVYQRNSTSTDLGWIPVQFNVKPSSLYVPNHGITTPTVVQIIATGGTGNLPSPLSSGSFYIANRLDDNRLTFTSTLGTQINFTDIGDTTVEYTVTGTLPNASANSITIPGNTLLEGAAITYDIDGGTTIGGLSDGTTYYTAFKSGDRFQLSTTANPFGASGACLAQNSSAWVNIGANRITIDGANPFTTGDAVQYSSLSPIIGLNNGQVYWVEVSSQYIYLYNSKAEALTGLSSDRVVLHYYGSGRGTFTEVNIIDLTSVPSPSETQILLADYVGAADGNYTVASTAADGLSFTFGAGSEIDARTTTVTAQHTFVAALNALYIENHGFISGDAVTYTTSGTTNINGLTSGNTYYVVRKNKDFLQFATTEDNAINNVVISLSETGSSASEVTGTVTLQPSTIVGSFNGQGAVSFTGGSRTIRGEGTSFTSYFNKGDTLFVNIPETSVGPTDITGVNSSSDVFTATAHGLTTGDVVYFEGDGAPGGINFANLYFVAVAGTDTFSVHYTKTDADANTNKVALSTIGTNATVTGMTDSGSIHEAQIDYVNSDGQITTVEALPADSQTSVDYLQNTSLLLRPDGFALHRPYDGGVELIPPTNPDSQMIRQTRKYFRYQSGKGIQVSFAVNFSPTSQIDSFTRSGDVGTIITRFPHRLSTGLDVFVSGSTNTNFDTLGTINLEVTKADDINGDPKFYVNGELPTTYTLYEGRTYRFDQSDSSNSGHPLRFSETPDGTHGGGTEYTTGVTKVGTPGSTGAYIEITVATDAPTLYTYCEVHPNYGFQVATPVDPDNNQANLWNGLHNVLSVVDDFTFTVQLDGTPSDNNAFGVVEYYVDRWENSSLRCGLFDDQNGIFFEYDGNELYCCRRSSIQQISGYANLEFRSSAVAGIDTKFLSQLRVGDYVVIKGQSHRVSLIDSDELMYITPSYRGVDAEKVIITKTETTRVPQSSWSMDVCDGTGYTGFYLDIHKIQMAYVDYSWYGAGKVRFGFKDQHGNVQYVHSFVHGNFFTEAYMRSGNIPARYEIQNIGQPSYVPALAHWGTSVIMDGRFDADRAYVFNATSPNVTLLGSESSGQVTVNGKVEYAGIYYFYRQFRSYPAIGYAIRLDVPSSTLNSFGAGTSVSGADLAADTKLTLPLETSVFPYQPYLPSIDSQQDKNNFSSTRATRNLLVIDRAPTGTSPLSSTEYTVGTLGEELNVTKKLPLISVRLAPSVDTSAPGFLGEREIINRMQLILNSIGILSTHAVTIELILNGQLSNNEWERVNPPSLSQLISHVAADTISGGASIYNFEAQGGTGTTARQPVLTTETLGEIATLGNSILGGDNVYPDGPDVLTVVANLSEDPSAVSATNPLIISGRVSWAESQA